jgi:hypothetical protein
MHEDAKRPMRTYNRMTCIQSENLDMRNAACKGAQSANVGDPAS